MDKKLQPKFNKEEIGKTQNSAGWEIIQRLAKEALEKIGSLYGIEQNAKAKNLTPDQILTLRQEKSAPLLQDLKTWLEEKLRKTPPKGMLGKAIQCKRCIKYRS